jgi:hypothetical protein
MQVAVVVAVTVAALVFVSAIVRMLRLVVVRMPVVVHARETHSGDRR